MKPGMQLIVYPVKDIARAKALPRGVGRRALRGRALLRGIQSRRPGDRPGSQRARERKEVTDVGGGKLIAWVEDADGNLIGLQQAPAEG